MRGLELASEKMFHLFYAYGNHNYDCHFSYYWTSQQVLADHHPAIYEQFKEGGFFVRRSYGKFNKVSPDQVIEQTINKDQKGPGGITGFSTSEDTVQRWGLTGHLVAKIRCDMEETLGIRRNKSKPEELQKSRVKHDEEVVCKGYNLLLLFLFYSLILLFHYSRAYKATEDVKRDPLKAESIGENKGTGIYRQPNQAE